MKELLVALLAWIATQTGLPTPPLPAVFLVAPQHASELAYAMQGSPGPDVRALYHIDSATIYMLGSWDAEDLRSQATLLHELVHHVQAFNRLPFACAGESERQAYRLTVQWLREQGAEDPYAVLNTDPFTIAVLSSCPDRD